MLLNFDISVNYFNKFGSYELNSEKCDKLIIEILKKVAFTFFYDSKIDYKKYNNWIGFAKSLWLIIFPWILSFKYWIKSFITNRHKYEIYKRKLKIKIFIGSSNIVIPF